MHSGLWLLSDFEFICAISPLQSSTDRYSSIEVKKRALNAKKNIEAKAKSATKRSAKARRRL